MRDRALNGMKRKEDTMENRTVERFSINEIGMESEIRKFVMNRPETARRTKKKFWCQTYIK